MLPEVVMEVEGSAESAGTPPSPSGPAASTTPKTGPQSRSKRGRYNPLACTECKRRKLKCIRSESDLRCQRCVTRALDCIYGRHQYQEAKPTSSKDAGDATQYKKLSDEIAFLRQQVSSLTGALQHFVGPDVSDAVNRSPTALQSSPNYTTSVSASQPDPKQPQFVGPTRSAFSLRIARTSLNQMGLSVEDQPSTGREESRAASTSENSSRNGSPALRNNEFEVLLPFNSEEVIRLLDLFQDEVESVYPCTSSKELALNAYNVLAHVKAMHAGVQSSATRSSPAVSRKDIQLLLITIAIAIVIESHGKNELSTRMIDAVERDTLRVARNSPIQLIDLQMVILLSIFYFHCDEELLAWRTIGIAARQAMEMGLHHNSSLKDNFPDLKSREQAIRVFWCTYALDRRWSFGTSLSFAFNDKDIDSDLPEPGADFSYLRCMVAHGRLCSKVWDAIPAPGSTFQTIPKDSVAYLDFLTQTWLSHIPPDLQLRHPRLGLAPRTQPRVMHRLRALLYLRGNHIRILIHRHFVISTQNVMSDIQSARLVVDIAIDSIQVLVHLNESSDIYANQQNAFNYFLLSALAIIMLAVCHAPSLFAKSCREGFLSATDLVRNFSRQSVASRRLWRSIQGLVPGVRTLGLQAEAESRRQESVNSAQNTPDSDTSIANPGVIGVGHGLESNYRSSSNFDQPWGNIVAYQDSTVAATVPDSFQISDDLNGIFDAFGQFTEQPTSNPAEEQYRLGEYGMGTHDIQEIARRFHGLI